MLISRFCQVIDEILFLPFRVQLVLALLTALVVAFCVGFPFAVLGLVLEMELVQHFLRSLGSRLPSQMDGVGDSSIFNHYSILYISKLHSHHLRIFKSHHNFPRACSSVMLLDVLSLLLVSQKGLFEQVKSWATLE